MTHLDSVLTENDLPISELWAACLDGELVPLSSTAFLVADLPETPVERALAIRPVLGARMLIERESAAWVYGARASAPRLHTVAMRYTERLNVSRYAATVREVVVRAGDTTSIAGVEITTRMRTAIDLARHSGYTAEKDGDVVGRLLATYDLVDCRDYLDRARNLPGKRVALSRITHALITSSVSRVSRR